MECPQCQHENRSGTRFCDECGSVIGSYVVGRPRRMRPSTSRREIAAAIGVIATGIAVISGIVIASPGWQRIIAAWRESSSTQPRSDRPHGFELPHATTGSPALTRGLVPSSTSSQPIPVAPTRAADSSRPADRSWTGPQLDMAQVMAGFLVSQFGQDPAWRTAQANADAHSPDSPEHAYWRDVAIAIRDGGYRPRQ